MGPIASLAASAGASEAALKLVLGQLAGYPLLLFYRKHLAHRETNLQHLYFFLSGLLLGHWVVGEGVTHQLYTIGGTYLLLQLCGGSLLSVALSFALNLSYLLAGYRYNGLEYDVSWTMPQCVLCLRLIGLTWDVYDGERQKKDPKSLSGDQTKAALASSPNILELLSHSFFIGGYFVGPQFSLRKYREVLSPGYQASLPTPGPLSFSLTRLLLSLAYLAFHVLGSLLLPEGWPATEEYAAFSLPARLFLLPLWTKFLLAKYLSVWLMAEGICALSGLSYLPPSKQEGAAGEGGAGGGGRAEGGAGGAGGSGASGAQEDKPDWRGCANVRLRTLESATWFHHYIEAFNINTNQWCMNYVFKRLKFLNNRMISQTATLLFLAVWHGWHSGYYLTFFNEFIVVTVEKDFSAVWNKSVKVAHWKEHPAYQTVSSLLGWSYVLLLLPHCFLPFALLSWGRYWPVYQGLFFLEYAIFLGYLLWGRLARAWLLSSNSPGERRAGGAGAGVKQD